MTPILILAAGQSSRMRGADKLLERIGDQTLLVRTLSRACAVNVSVFVALPSADHPRTNVLQSVPATQLYVPQAAEGMSGTLRGAIAQMPPFDRLMVLLADLPDITSDDIAAVLAAPATSPQSLIWRGATVDGLPGHPILFDGSLRSEFAGLHGDDGAASIVKAHKSRTHLVPLPGQNARLDLDTPEAWADWRRKNPN